jgi:hypothetical protein
LIASKIDSEQIPSVVHHHLILSHQTLCLVVFVEGTLCIAGDFGGIHADISAKARFPMDIHMIKL